MQPNSANTDAADARRFHAALSDLLRVYQYRDRDRICCHDISVTQCHALDLLVERGPLRSLALAEAMHLDKSTVSRVVDALVRKAYVERLADPDDARAVQLRATRDGRALQQRIRKEMIAEEGRLLADLDPAVRAGVIEVLRRLARAAESRILGRACAAPGCGDDARPCT